MKPIISKILCVTLFIISFPAIADGDPRYCGIENIQRDQQNQIVRSQVEYQRFRSWWACPSTLTFKGACAGWSVDHQIPIAVGGCDAAHNMQWLKVEIKSCAGNNCKDRWERKIYAPDRRGF